LKEKIKMNLASKIDIAEKLGRIFYNSNRLYTVVVGKGTNSDDKKMFWRARLVDREEGGWGDTRFKIDLYFDKVTSNDGANECLDLLINLMKEEIEKKISEKQEKIEQIKLDTENKINAISAEINKIKQSIGEDNDLGE